MSRKFEIALLAFISAVLIAAPLTTPICLASDHRISDSQHVENYYWTRGCSPTAAAMALSYYDNTYSNYGKLIMNYRDELDLFTGHVNDVPDLLDKLATAMGTDSEGGTFTDSIHTGIVNVTNSSWSAGYAFSSRYVRSSPFGDGFDWCWNLIKQEIDANRPFVWSSNRSSWVVLPGDGHSMAAIGYTDDKKVIVRDPNYGSNPEISGTPVERRWRYNYYEYDQPTGAYATSVDTIQAGGGSTGDVKIIEPDGGESYGWNKPIRVGWYSFGTTLGGASLVKNAKLCVSADSGKTELVCSPLVPCHGLTPNYYDWNVTLDPGCGYRIRIYGYDSNNVLRAGDSSVHDFEIPPLVGGYVKTAAGAPISGVVIDGLPGSPVTDGNGYYETVVKFNWTGTGRPTKAGWTFSPTYKEFIYIKSNQYNYDFIGSPLTYSISGYVKTAAGAAVSSVLMSGLPGNPITDANGYYTGTVTYGWSGTVTPTKGVWTFTPPSRTYTSVTASWTSQDYTGVSAPLNLTGWVTTSAGAGIPSVVMNGLPGNPTTEANGYYAAIIPSGWSGTVTPSKSGWTFSPSSRTYNNLVSSWTSQNYTGSVSESLLLNNSRFRATIAWQTSDGTTGIGHPVGLTGDSGYFWFFGANNVEVLLKVLNGTGTNGCFWVFYGALTDVAFTLQITDTVTGTVKTYVNPQGVQAGGHDVGAFPQSLASARPLVLSREIRSFSAELRGRGQNAVLPQTTTIDLNGGRFRAQVSWATPDGATGAGSGVLLTADSGYFWFFQSSNIELILKVLDGRGVNGKFWVFYGSLTDVKFTLTITDIQTGSLRVYAGQQGVQKSGYDLQAF